MEKTLGLDLGTNSIGWALRDINADDNQITDKGVITFDKGVGEEKGIEVPLVKARTAARSKRRNYQAEKYRKWALVKCLIEKGMCPLLESELYWWKRYQKDNNGVQQGRKYPESKKFRQWLQYDFNGDGKPDYQEYGYSIHENIYLFRVLAISENEEHKKIFKDNPEILGRVFYHLVQRRGFKGRVEDDKETQTILLGSKEANTPGVNELIPFIEKYKTLGAALYYINKNEGYRIRKRYNRRQDFEKELFEICRVQGIPETVQHELWKAIIWQRPLRSQKGLVGYCTFERPQKNEKGQYIKGGKTRCPISHPLYQEYRTWQLISNLKIVVPDDIDKVAFLTDKVYPLFIRDSEVEFVKIKKEIEKVGGIVRAKFDDETRFPTNDFLYRIKEIYGENWRIILKWEETLTNKPKSGKYHRVEDLWHEIYHFIHLKSTTPATFYDAIANKLHFDDKQIKSFKKLKLDQGYASLSISAITKILPYLQKGLLYSEAVFLANLNKIFATELTPETKTEILSAFRLLSISFNENKLRLGIVNSLISDQLNSSTRFGMNSDYALDDDDINDIKLKIEDTIGVQNWNKKEDIEKVKLLDFIAEKYLIFLQKPVNYDANKSFYKIKRFDQILKEYLVEKYDFSIEHLNKNLWHPSEIEKYDPAPSSKKVPNIKILGDPNPVGKGFKNPMAMKTLHRLRNLINYLLESGKIDSDTRIVVELARELNDANRRKAIQNWQKRREDENKELAKGIINTAKVKYPDLDENDPLIADRARLWYEQIENSDEIMRQAKALKDDLLKVKLWKEQNCRCIYTGRIISISNLFNGTEVDIEHTIPAKISWSSEQWNLTICDSKFNREIKRKKIPADLINYETTSEFDKDGANILKRIEPWAIKLKSLNASLQKNINQTKGSNYMDKNAKDEILIKRRMLQMDIEYWNKKIETFTKLEYLGGFRRQQLTDTQIASKYAFHYLKTVFNRVEIQKGITTSTFRKIFKIQNKKELKDRTKHSHHAIDAAVLTLIPPSSIRTKMLDEYNNALDMNQSYHKNPIGWDNFKASYLLNLEETILINYQKKDTTLLQTKKKMRIGGKIQFIHETTADGINILKRDLNGKPIPKMAVGTGIRGQLHKDSFYGSIKINDQLMLVERYPIESFDSLKDCTHIIDKKIKEIVKTELINRVESGMSFDKAKFLPIFFPGSQQIIKKVRCRVAAGRGYLTSEKAIEISIKNHISKYEHKQNKYVQNYKNSLCLFYINSENNLRGLMIVNLFELSFLKIKTIQSIKQENFYRSITLGKGKNKSEALLENIIHVGDKFIFYKESKDELLNLSHSEISKRLYTIYKFNEPAPSTVYIYLQHHLESRSNDELGNGEKLIDFGKYQPRLFLSASKLNCAMEGLDFHVTPDGHINWIIK